MENINKKLFFFTINYTFCKSVQTKTSKRFFKRLDKYLKKTAYTEK